jgi:flagellar biosynthetic protein FliR
MVSVTVSLAQLNLFFLVFLRTGAFLMSVPILNAPSVPALVRIALALAAGLLVFPSLGLSPNGVPPDVFSLAIAGAGELLLGVLMGFTWRMVFEGIQLAGQLAGYQMGLAVAEVIDPGSEDQVALLSQMTTLLAMVVFLAMNGHHGFVRLLAASYAHVPPFGFGADARLIEGLIRLTAESFVIGIQAGAPVIAALLLATIAFGLVARTVPQLNIFVVSMPLNIALGLLFFGLSLPYLLSFLGDLFGGAARQALQLLQAVP